MELNSLERFGFDVEAEGKGDLSVFDKVKKAAEEIKNYNDNISLEEEKRKLTKQIFALNLLWTCLKTIWARERNFLVVQHVNTTVNRYQHLQQTQKQVA